MRGVKKDVTSSASFGDLRIRFKHETLMQDYQELNKETGFMRRKLEMMKQKRSTLRAEVRFLRRRYKHLMQNQTLVNPPVPRFDLNKKVPMCNEKDAMANATSDLDKKQRKNNGNEGSRNLMSLPDLNQTERTCNGDGYISSSSKIPVFDLNQISREEEELQVNGEHMAVEETKNVMVGVGNDELHNEIKLSVCRNIKKGLSRAAKRKVSWQDPVALRV